MDNHTKGKLGEKYVRRYFLKKGYTVAGLKKGEKGYDFFVSKSGKSLRIEIKTTERDNHIPDMHDNEFIIKNKKILFRADYLYIVVISNGGKIRYLHILSKKEIDTYAHKHKIVRRIRTSKMQTEMRNNKHFGKVI